MGEPRLLTIVRWIDSVSLWTGRMVAWLAVPMVLGLGYEVVARYGFNASTVWAYDLTYMLYGTFFMLGSAYTLAQKGHIRTDTFYADWSPRTQGAVDAACYVLFFFPAMLALLWIGSQFFGRSFGQNERIVTSTWMPVVYPFKFVIPLTAALLLLQGVSELLKCVWAMRKGEWP